ncbi:MAG: hypothetical protein H7175_22405 [Burkholderiales bacterium]|nr:hypothetical protein [Anaerolineae bacterium]
MIVDDPVLGAVIANYPSDRGRPLILGGVVCAAAAVILNFTVAAIPDWWGPLLTVIIMAAIVLVVGWYLAHIWNREVILYQRGFSYREGATTVFFLYKEVITIRQRAEQLAYFGGLFRRVAYQITIKTVRDEQLVLTNVYKRIAELGARLEDKINETLRPDALRKLAQGGSVIFADGLWLDGEGLHSDGRVLSWAEFGGYRIHNRQLHFTKRGDEAWAALPLSDIDNITLLLDILRSQQEASVGAGAGAAS